ncbi:NYN domain-containing protein [Ligilactobacillus saerimneri]|uniref:NYN domain-containing protein n=1 Tax=Ligilactobacillus saerimneri TaxID=228229 RepID=A0A7H9EN64_9LACO|nr:NYN domain-containing protein [Ligilactobacillus saerimneri]QLL78769.1 NYN domain-containing protein [Ligilactobacillus saerimneri]
MKKNILIVDAYNMIGNWPELDRLKKADRLEEARDQLLHILSNYKRQTTYDIIVAFDAMYVPGLSRSYEQYGLRVVWTAEEQTADSYIESLAGELQNALTQVTVATSDQAEQWTVFAQGAMRVPAWELYQNIKRAKHEVRQQARRYQDEASVRRSPWDQEQLDKLAALRDKLSQR